MEPLTLTGGASIGWVSATSPFARLAASPNSIKITGLLGTYNLSRRDVISLEPAGSLPFFSSGVRIVHTRADYPKRIVFFSLRNPRKLIESIRVAGFNPSGVRTSRDVTLHTFPFRWVTLVFFIALWNLLLFTDQQLPGTDPGHPGPLTFVALALAFAISWLALRSDWMQGLLMREGESVGRIKPFLLLLQILSGLMMVIFIITFFGHHVAG